MCNCKACQVSKKSLLEKYAYFYAQHEDAKYVLQTLIKAGVKPSFTKLNEEDPLNELACVMNDQETATACFLAEAEEKHPELKDWIKNEDS